MTIRAAALAPPRQPGRTRGADSGRQTSCGDLLPRLRPHAGAGSVADLPAALLGRGLRSGKLTGTGRDATGSTNNRDSTHSSAYKRPSATGIISQPDRS